MRQPTTRTCTGNAARRVTSVVIAAGFIAATVAVASPSFADDFADDPPAAVTASHEPPAVQTTPPVAAETPGEDAAAAPLAATQQSAGSLAGTVSFSGRGVDAASAEITVRLSQRFDGVWSLIDLQELSAGQRSFSFGNLDPGEYTLKFTGSNACMTPDLAPGADSRAIEDYACGFHETWWNSKQSAVSASPIRVEAGQHLKGYNATIVTNHIDVKRGHKFYDAVRWLYDEAISTGVSGPNGNIYQSRLSVTREAMAAFLYRAAGSPKFTAPSTQSFVDVPKTHKFYREIEWMRFRGISTGTQRPDGTRGYDPQASVTREAMAAFLYRFVGAGPVGANTAPAFIDVQPGQPFAKEITWLATVGVATGFSTPDGLAYKPKDAVTREAMAAFLYRADAL